MQGANDFVIFAIAGAGSFGSGFLFRAAGEQWQTGWRFLVWSVVGLMATLVALLLLFSILGRPRPHGGDGSPTDSTTTGGLGLLNSRSETGDADLLPRTGSVLSALPSPPPPPTSRARPSPPRRCSSRPRRRTTSGRARRREGLVGLVGRVATPAGARNTRRNSAARRNTAQFGGASCCTISISIRPNNNYALRQAAKIAVHIEEGAEARPPLKDVRMSRSFSCLDM